MSGLGYIEGDGIFARRRSDRRLDIGLTICVVLVVLGAIFGIGALVASHDPARVAWTCQEDEVLAPTRVPVRGDADVECVNREDVSP